MRKLLFIFFFAIAFFFVSVPTQAQMFDGSDLQYHAGKSTEVLPVGTGSAVSFDPSIYTTTYPLPTRAYFYVDGYPIRIWYDGSVPTATEGIYIPASATFQIIGWSSIENFKAISVGASTATLQVSYESKLRLLE